MSDTNTAPAGSGQEPPATGTPGQEPTATPPAAPAGTPHRPARAGEHPAGRPGAPATEDTDPRIRAANAEAARYRREAREAQARADAAEAANLTEAQRIEKERDDLRKANETLVADNRTLKVNTALSAALRAAGLRVQDTVEILGSKIQLDAEGNPTGVTEAVTALLAERPYLAVTGTPARQGPGAAPAPPVSPSGTSARSCPMHRSTRSTATTS